ncbi:importin beta-4 subunit [Ascosphaera apis ARSEF 7405]|uniref:Importin beta-4 subunit n=1 Tax=Ascosphaera apis ARSEF 7405 TaxID=392613 RepID=A0A167VCN7_9EURO|nr:importin beta-4 subunit [Ascosphaera apis ARSEF 7405]
MDTQKFLQQLRIVINPTQGSVKDATATLQKEFYPHPESALFLIQIITSNEEAPLRQLAAVECRTVMQKHWEKLPEAQKPAIREQLLRATLNEPEHLVRNSLARIISTIARIDLEDGQWAELPSILVQAANSSRAEERAVGIYILYAILDTLGEGFQDKFVDLIRLLGNTIQDPESQEVRINSLLALGNLAMHLDSDEDEAPVRVFQSIVPSMVHVLKEAITHNDEAKVMQSFEVFQTLINCDPLLLKTSFKDLLLLMKDIAVNTDLAEDTRTQAISFLMQAVRYRKLKIQAMQIGSAITLAALQITTELDDESPDDDEITPARSALGLLEMLSTNLPPNQVVVPLLQACGQYFTNPDPNYRRAAIMSLGMCVEGAPDFISTQMNEIFPVVLQMLKDPETKVRGATLHGVARLAEAVTEDVSDHQRELMPLLIQNLSAAMQEYKGEEEGPIVDFMNAAVVAIDATVSCMDESDIVPYQDDLIPVLHKLFEHPSLKIKGITAGCIGSIAASAGSAFLPYFDRSMHLMQDYVTIKSSQDELELRANIIDAMGEMSASAGPENFKNYVQPLMRATEEGLHLDHSRLKETTYLFWGSMSKVYGEDFTPFLDGIVKGLFECLEQDEIETDVSVGDEAKNLIGQEVTIGGRKLRVTSGDGEDDIHVSGAGFDDDDSDEEVDWEDLTTVTPVSLEKEVAVEVIADIITHTKKAYLPYFEKTIEHILPLAEHPYEGVRRSMIGTLHRSYATLWHIAEESGQMEKWEPGKPLVEPPTEVKKLTEIVMTATLKMWTDEDDPSVVADVNRNVAENLRYCGPFILSGNQTLDNMIALISAIVTKKHPCQFAADMEGDEELEQTSEFDWVVIDTALDVVSGLATALGAEFVQVWHVFEKIVLRFASSGESLERATAVGVLAEVITGMGAAVSPFTGKFMTVLLRRLSDEDPQTKSNAAYAIGRLIEKTEADQEVMREYPTILEKLERCLAIPQARLPDNASGCLARMILKHKDLVPIPDVLPALLTVLPLQSDMQENDPVYRMICQLYKWQDPTVQSLTPQLITVFSAVLSGPEDALEDERRAELIELVKWLNSMQPGIAAWIDQIA